MQSSAHTLTKIVLEFGHNCWQNIAPKNVYLVQILGEGTTIVH